MKNVMLEEFERLTKQYRKKYTICPSCSGVGCLPENFGIGNPNVNKACVTCNGKGSVLIENGVNNASST